MILKGRSRAQGNQLATYLLSAKNEQVRVIDIRGTVCDERNAQGLRQSLSDFDELGKMTKGQSTLFHLALNPNDRDHLTPADWGRCIAKVEKALGLEEQPRAVVSHIYNGKEHFHVVWSRVDVETRKCVPMSFSHLKLCQTAREIESELGLTQAPQRARGAHQLKQRNKEIQQHQEERTATPREVRRAAIQSAWNKANSGGEFKERVEAAGYRLVVGKRGVLVMDSDQEKHSICRYVEGIKLKHVHEKLGDLDWKTLPKATDFKTRTKRQTDGEVEGENTIGHRALEAAPAQPMRRQAQNSTLPRITRELTAQQHPNYNDEAPPAEPIKEPIKRLKGESEESYTARVEWMRQQEATSPQSDTLQQKLQKSRRLSL